MSHYKDIIDQMKKPAYSHGTWEVFSDFLALSAISLSNAVDLRQREAREAEYMRIIGKYKREEVDCFPRMFASLVMAMEEEPGDILGRIFGELKLGNKWAGQFFTPDSVSRMMGKMMLAGELREKIEASGFITVQEPAIGGGALVINLALAMQEEGINYQQAMVVTGIDVDIKSIHMSYIQLSLLHIPAILVHGDALSLKVFSPQWHTPAYILGGWAWRRQRETEITPQPKEEPHNAIPLVLPLLETRKAQYEALSLFDEAVGK